MFDGSQFEEETILLRSGDLICFCTDGIVDAFDKEDEAFGMSRLEKLLLASRRLPPTEIARQLVASVEKFSGDGARHDDTTVIVLKSG